MSEPVSVTLHNSGSQTYVWLANATDQDLLVATRVDGQDANSPYDTLVGDLNGPVLLKNGDTNVALGRYNYGRITSVDVIALSTVSYNGYPSP